MKRARAAGWQPSSETADKSERFGAVDDDGCGTPGNNAVSVLGGYIGEIIARPVPVVEELVEGIMSKGEVVISHGQPGAFKTGDKIALAFCLRLVATITGA